MAITIGGKTPQSINIGGKDVQSLAINGEIVWSKSVQPEKFYLEARAASTKITITRSTNSMTSGNHLDYSKDGSTWTRCSYSSNKCNITLTNSGDRLYLRSDNGLSYGSSNTYKISADKNFAAGGDLKDLIDYTASGQVTAPNYVFYGLFNGAGAYLVDVSNISFANISTLGNYSCSNMFYGCTSITRTPTADFAVRSYTSGFSNMFYGCTSLNTINVTLPNITTSSTYMFSSMFQGCTALTTIPSGLFRGNPAGNSSCSQMFKGCTSLTTIPSNLLSGGTTLAESCYRYMFEGCTSLVNVSSSFLPATTAALSCYEYMFSGCTSLKTVPTIEFTTLANFCCSYMFYQCSALVNGPEIKTTTLDTSISKPFRDMFVSCTSIAWIKFHATNWGTGSSYTSMTDLWLSSAKNASTCKFYLPSAAVTPARSTSGVPSNWTIVRF